MKYFLSLGLLLLGLVIQAVAAAPPPPKNPAADPKEAERETAKLLAQTYIEGSLFSVDAEAKKFTLHVAYKAAVLNQKMQQQVANLSNQLNGALTNRRPNLGQINNLKTQLADAESKLYDQVDASIDLELQGADKLHVRTLTVPTKEDGGKLSAPELAAIQGNFGLPGYPAKIEDLEKDKVVRVYIDKSKLGVGKPKDGTYPVTTIVLTKEASTAKKNAKP